MKILRKLRIPLIAIALLLVAGLVWFLPKLRTPAPQTAFVAGTTAPDFTLNDQSGNPVTLSSLRGTKVLLYFYRGYW